MTASPSDGPPARRSSKVAVAKLLMWVDQLAGESTVYLTQADFVWGSKSDPHRYKTTQKYLKSIGTVFVDLDVYAVERWRGTPIDDVAQAVLRQCDDAGVPRPVLICSGRGLYADWALTERLDIANGESGARWKRVQNKLMNLLRPFGADPKVSDITRVLRLVGTFNPKADALVRVCYDDGARLDFERLESATLGLEPWETRKRVAKNESAAQAERDWSHQPKGKKPRQAKAVTPTQAAPPRVDPGALGWLRTLLAADEPVVPKLSNSRQRQYRLFRDIAEVVLSRGGLAHGHRDEFQFWMLVTRFNAGLFAPDELPILAERFARLSEDALNLWDAGMLSTLHARMLDQVAATGPFRAPSATPAIRVRGAFYSAPAYTGSHRQADGMADSPLRSPALSVENRRPVALPVIVPLRMSAVVEQRNRQRSRVYTPSVTTLITKLAITEVEQQTLSILIGGVERARRRSLTLKRRQRERRDTSLVRRQAESEISVADLAFSAGVSRSHAYRILRKRETESIDAAENGLPHGGGRLSGLPARTLSGKARALQEMESAVIARFRANPEQSIRSIAAKLGANPSSAYRWIQRVRRITEVSQAALRQYRNENILSRIALTRSFGLPDKRGLQCASGPSREAAILSVPGSLEDLELQRQMASMDRRVIPDAMFYSATFPSQPTNFSVDHPAPVPAIHIVQSTPLIASMGSQDSISSVPPSHFSCASIEGIQQGGRAQAGEGFTPGVQRCSMAQPQGVHLPPAQPLERSACSPSTVTEDQPAQNHGDPWIAACHPSGDDNPFEGITQDPVHVAAGGIFPHPEGKSSSVPAPVANPAMSISTTPRWSSDRNLALSHALSDPAVQGADRLMIQQAFADMNREMSTIQMKAMLLRVKLLRKTPGQGHLERFLTAALTDD